ncbi:hypothetical protein BGZ94_003425 [Podila epigama]|nr:hypothetical protein BGZ94_003425 [Podila epigama]
MSNAAVPLYYSRVNERSIPPGDDNKNSDDDYYGDPDYNDNDSCEDYDDDEDQEDLDDPDPAFEAAALRQMVPYAGSGGNFDIPVVAQFLIPASAVFRDVLTMGPEQDSSTSSSFSSSSSSPEKISHHLLNQQRLVCLRFISVPSQNDSLLPNSTTLLNKHQQHGNLHQLPILELDLPFPEHILPLLQVMYDLNLDQWTATFTPETVGPIAANVSHLECSTNITLRCLEYYHQLKLRSRGDVARLLTHDPSQWQDLEELYQRAASSGLLS